MSSIDAQGSEALDDLYWRGEVLQVMYWLRGEGLGEEIAPAALAEFLMAEQETVAQQMQRLASDGYLDQTGPHGPLSYRLSPLGVVEGGRSFQDEFADFVHQAHFECGPGCWCKDPKRRGEPCPNGVGVRRGA